MTGWDFNASLGHFGCTEYKYATSNGHEFNPGTLGGDVQRQDGWAATCPELPEDERTDDERDVFTEVIFYCHVRKLYIEQW